MRVWITRYALSKGIIEMDVEPPRPGLSNMIFNRTLCSHYSKPHWHESEAQAHEQVQTMLSKEKARLRKRLRTLATLAEKAHKVTKQ